MYQLPDRNQIPEGHVTDLITDKTFGPWLRGRLRARKLTMVALEKYGISERLLRNIFKGASLSERTIACLRDGLTREDPAALPEFESYVEGPPILRRFSDLEHALRKIDDLVTTALGSFEETLMPRAAAERSAIHRALIDEGLRKLGISSLENFQQFLKRRAVLAGLVQTLPSPDLVVEVSPRVAKGRIARLSYQVAGRRPVVLHGSALLWGDPRLAGKARAEIEREFFGGNVEIRWGDLPFRWRRSPVLWPPSVGSFVFIDILRRKSLDHFTPDSLADVGSGIGFLGIALRQDWPSVRQVWFSDWLLTPLLYSAVNWALNDSDQQRRNGCEPHFHCGLQLQDFLATKAAPFDVAVCNSYYLPRHHEHQRLSLQLPLTAGTDLLTDVVRNGTALARTVFLQYSNIANAEINRVIGTTRLRPLSRPIPMPFRATDNVLGRPAYVSFLKTCGLRKTKTGYAHRLQAYQIGPDET